ncbi:MAG: hypothetical protein BHW64_03485 [Candidatus Melainabacteria bacterium LEY3_CP_29_8]|nr:MAG: hypothetical protein BHW64_03485 [Candidatus Melainabacteria bacterium LEY3_CP_29_8]
MRLYAHNNFVRNFEKNLQEGQVNVFEKVRTIKNSLDSKQDPLTEAREHQQLGGEMLGKLLVQTQEAFQQRNVQMSDLLNLDNTIKQELNRNTTPKYTLPKYPTILQENHNLYKGTVPAMSNALNEIDPFFDRNDIENENVNIDNFKIDYSDYIPTLGLVNPRLGLRFTIPLREKLGVRTIDGLTNSIAIYLTPKELSTNYDKYKYINDGNKIFVTYNIQKSFERAELQYNTQSQEKKLTRFSNHDYDLQFITFNRDDVSSHIMTSPAIAQNHNPYVVKSDLLKGTVTLHNDIQEGYYFENTNQILTKLNSTPVVTTISTETANNLHKYTLRNLECMKTVFKNYSDALNRMSPILRNINEKDGIIDDNNTGERIEGNINNFTYYDEDNREYFSRKIGQNDDGSRTVIDVLYYSDTSKSLPHYILETQIDPNGNSTFKGQIFDRNGDLAQHSGEEPMSEDFKNTLNLTNDEYNALVSGYQHIKTYTWNKDEALAELQNMQ